MGVFKKNGSWWIDYYLADGRRKREKIGPSKDQAGTVLNKRRVQVAEGKFLDVKREKKHRFSEATIRFLEYSKSNKESYRRDEGMVRRHLLPAFGRKHLDTITTWDIEKFKAKRKNEVKPASVNREIACLKTIFNKAILWGMTKDNPVRGIKTLHENNERVRYLERDEIPKLLAECAEHLRPIVITALNTGMRQGEIFRLEWDVIDFQRGQIHVRKTKNGESRVLEMNSPLSSTLRQIRRRPQYPQVFLGRTGKPVKDCRTAFENAVRRAGITDFTFHDLRHTFASHHVMNGTDLLTLKELLGHKNLQMTMRYAHLSQQHKKKAVEAVGAVLSGHHMDTKAKKPASVQFGTHA